MTQRYTLEQFDPREVMWVFERYNDYYFTFSHLQEDGERWISSYPVKWWLKFGGDRDLMERIYPIERGPISLQQILDAQNPITDDEVKKILEGENYDVRIWAEEWEIKDIYNTGLGEEQ